MCDQGVKVAIGKEGTPANHDKNYRRKVILNIIANSQNAGETINRLLNFCEQIREARHIP